MKLKKSQIALSNYPYYKYSLNYTLDSLQRLGAKAIELYACDPHFHIDDCGLPQVAAIKKNLAAHGLHPICLTPEQVKYPINIGSINPVRRKSSVETYTKAIQFAHELECPKVQFHAGVGTLDDSYDNAWMRSADSLSYLADIAEGYGVMIVMESARPITTVLISSVKVAKMIEEINSRCLRGMIDTLTLVLCNEDVDTAIKNIGVENMCHFHFSDVKTKEQQNLHLIPGEGDMDLEHVLQALDEINYSGYITLEMMSPYEYVPEEATRKGAEWLRARLSD